MSANNAKSKSNIYTYNMGDLICAEGEPLDSIYRLVEGKVGIFVHQNPLSDLDGGGDSAIASFGISLGSVVHAGDMVGLGGLFDKTRTASVRAMADKTTLEQFPFGPAGVTHLIHSQPLRGLDLGESLARRFVDLSHNANIATSAVPSLQRSLDALKFAFHNIHTHATFEAEKCGDAKLEASLDKMRKLSIAVEGKRLTHYRNNVRDILTAALAERAAKLVNLRSGESFSYNTDIGSALSQVLEGILSVLVESEQIGLMGEGDFIGMAQVFLKDPLDSTATLKALRTTRLACLPRASFRLLAQDKPELLTALIYTLSNRLELIYRMVRKPHTGLEEELNRFAGTPESCAEAFGQLAWVLSEGQCDFRNLCAIATRLSDQAKKAKHSLDESCGRILEICAGIHDNLPMNV